MKGLRGVVRHSPWLSVGAAALLVACAAGTAGAEPVVLGGSQEVPPVTTNAMGIADISIVQHKCPGGGGVGGLSGSDCPTVVGTVSISGANITAVHIHQGASGQNGPVVVPLARRPGTDNVWDVPSKSTVSQAVYEAWWSGNTYVNAHSAANPGGEIRAQLRR
jgi:hypothetical protein